MKNKFKGITFIKLKRTILGCRTKAEMQRARKMVKLWRQSPKSTSELYLEIFLLFIGKENQLTIQKK